MSLTQHSEAHVALRSVGDSSKALKAAQEIYAAENGRSKAFYEEYHTVLPGGKIDSTCFPDHILVRTKLTRGEPPCRDHEKGDTLLPIFVGIRRR